MHKKIFRCSKIFNDINVVNVIQEIFDDYRIVDIGDISKSNGLIKVRLFDEDQSDINLSINNDQIFIEKSNLGEIEKIEVTSFLVRSLKFELREKGIIVVDTTKHYVYSYFSQKVRALTDLKSIRYVLKESKLENIIPEFTCSDSGLRLFIKRYFETDLRYKMDDFAVMKTSFVSHFATAVKINGDFRYGKFTSYPTYTYLNGKDISHIYDIVDGIDKVSRIFDLYNGKISLKNRDDLFSINLGLLNDSAFNLRARECSIPEKILVGLPVAKISQSYKDSVSDFLSEKIGFTGEVDFTNDDSLMEAIKYVPTAQDRLKKKIQEKTGMSYEEFNTLSMDEQMMLLNGYKIQYNDDETIDVLPIGNILFEERVKEFVNKPKLFFKRIRDNFINKK